MPRRRAQHHGRRKDLEIGTSRPFPCRATSATTAAIPLLLLLLLLLLILPRRFCLHVGC